MSTVPYGQPGWFEAYCRAWHTIGDTLRTFFASDGVYIDVASGLSLKAEELGAFVESWAAFSPDSRIRFGTHVGDPHHFSVEWKWTGTATGTISLDGLTLVGRGGRFEVDGVTFGAVDDTGVIAWHKDYWDMSALVEQCTATRDE